MTIKITAITASACAVLLYVLATIFPNDPFFYVFISSSLAVAIGRLVLSFVLIHVAFKKEFRSVYGAYASALSAILFIIFSFLGLFANSITYSLFNWFKPMDYIFMLESGVLFGLAALSYERGTARLPKLPWPRRAGLRLFAPHGFNVSLPLVHKQNG